MLEANNGLLLAKNSNLNESLFDVDYASKEIKVISNNFRRRVEN